MRHTPRSPIHLHQSHHFKFLHTSAFLSDSLRSRSPYQWSPLNVVFTLFSFYQPSLNLPLRPGHFVSFLSILFSQSASKSHSPCSIYGRLLINFPSAFLSVWVGLSASQTLQLPHTISLSLPPNIEALITFCFLSIFFFCFQVLKSFFSVVVTLFAPDCFGPFFHFFRLCAPFFVNSSASCFTSNSKYKRANDWTTSFGLDCLLWWRTVFWVAVHWVLLITLNFHI